MRIVLDADAAVYLRDDDIARILGGLE